MKIVFNYALGALLCLLLLGSMQNAHAEATYFTKKTLLTNFFPDSDRISFTEFKPSAAERKQLKRRLGYELSRSSYYFFVATTGSHVDGYAFIDDEMGQHKPMTFGVKLSPEGVVLRQELMVYRETRGDEVRKARFRRQFKGKTIHDALRPNKDIDCVSGATISSRAITTGVRRALVLFDAALGAKQVVRVSSASN